MSGAKRFLDPRPVYMQHHAQQVQQAVDLPTDQVFEYIGQEPEFLKSSWAEQLEVRDAMAHEMIQASGLQGRDAYYAQEKFKRRFNAQFKPGAYEQFKNDMHDAIWAMPKIGAQIAKGGWAVTKGALEVLGPEDSARLQGTVDWIENQQELLDDFTRERTRGANAELYEWVGYGMPIGGAAGLGMRALHLRAAPFAKGLIEPATATYTKSAFSAGLGDVAIHTALDRVIEPVVMASEMSDGAKQMALVMATLGTGLFSATTLERQIDNLIRNQVFTGAAEAMAKRGMKASRVVRDPVLMRLLAEPLEDEFPGITARAMTVAEENQLRWNAILDSKGVRLFDDPELSQMKDFYKIQETLGGMVESRNGMAREIQRLHDETGRYDVFGARRLADRAPTEPTPFDEFVPFKTHTEALARANELGLGPEEVHLLPNKMGYLVGRRTLGSEELEMFARLAKSNEDVFETAKQMTRARKTPREIGDDFVLKKSDGTTEYQTRTAAERALRNSKHAEYLEVVRVPDGGYEVRGLARAQTLSWDDYPAVRDFTFGREPGVRKLDINAMDEQDIRHNYKIAQSKIRPGNPYNDEHMQILREFEDLLGIVGRRPTQTPEDLAKRIDSLINDGFISKHQAGVMRRILDMTKKYPGFDIATHGGPGGVEGRFSAFHNMMLLKHPRHFAHEFGHYVWHRVLTKQERLDYMETVWKHYNTDDARNRLWPARQRILDKGLGHEAKDSVTEMFAENVQHYLFSHRLTVPESKVMLEKVDKGLKWIYRAYSKEKDFPNEIRRFMHNVFRNPDVHELSVRRPQEMRDFLNRHWMHMSQEEFMLQVERAGANKEAYDLWFAGVVRNGEDGMSALARTSGDIESIIDNVYADVLRWHHTGGVDPGTIDIMMRRLVEIFDIRNKPATLERIKASRPKRVRTKYEEGVSPDEMTRRMPGDVDDDQARHLTNVRRAKAAASSGEEAVEAAAVENIYYAGKQMVNDLGQLVHAYKLIQQGGSAWPTIMRHAEKTFLNHRAERAAERSAEARQKWLDEHARKVQRAEEDGWTDPDSWLDDSLLGASQREALGIQIRLYPQLVSAAMGLRFDDENGVEIPGIGMVTWDPVTWTKRFGPVLSMWSAARRPITRAARDTRTNLWNKISKNSPEWAELQQERWKRIYKNPFFRAFHPREMLEGGLARVHEETPKAEIRIMSRFTRLAERINKEFTHDEQRMISELITRDGSVDISRAGKEVIDQATEVKRFLNNAKELLIASGMPRKVFDQFGDDWLPRIYANRGAFRHWNTPHELKALQKEYRSIGANYLQPRGLGHTLRRGERAHSALLEHSPSLRAGQKVFDFGEGDARFFVGEDRADIIKSLKDQQIKFNSEWEVQTIDAQAGKIVMRRDYSKLEREVMGEVLEVAPRIVQAGKQMAKDIAFGRAIKNIGKLENMVFDAKEFAKTLPRDTDTRLAVANERARLKNAGWIELPTGEAAKGTGIKRYGELAGKLVDPEVHYVLKATTRMHRPDRGWVRKLFNVVSPIIKTWKVAKTAYNPGTHGRNFTANLWMCTFDGRTPWSVVGEGATHIFRKDELFHRAIDAGMLDSNLMRGELNLGAFMDMANNRILNAKNMSQSNDNMMLDYFTKVGQSIKQKAIHAATRPLRWYELGDEVFKMGIFAQEVRKGRSDLEAIAEAQRLFFDYRDVPSGIQFVRDWGIVPFATYTYKVLPLMVSHMKNHPHRVVAAIGAFEMLNAAMYRHQADSVEEYQALKERDYDKHVMADFVRRRIYGMGPVASANIGTGTNEYGVEYTNRYDYIMNMPGGDALSMHGIFQGFPFGMNPLVTVMYGLLTNTDPSFENQIMPHEETFTKKQKADNARAMVEFILRTCLPNVPLYPGAWSLDKLGNALTAQGVIDPEVADHWGWTGMDYWGTPASLGAEMVNFLGVGRVRRLYPEEEAYRRVAILDASFGQWERKLDRMAQDMRTSDTEFENAIAGMLDHVAGGIIEIERVLDLVDKVYTAREKTKAKSGQMRKEDMQRTIHQSSF
jgi:hypothetical protein